MDQANVQKRLRIRCAGLYVLFLGASAHEAWTVPEFIKPVVGVFGKAPLGLPAPLFGWFLMIIGTLPLFVFLWHVMQLMIATSATTRQPAQVRDITGVARLFGSAFHLRGQDAQVARHFNLSLVAFTVFIALTITWIVATERAGV